jgi:hypothetical protein
MSTANLARSENMPCRQRRRRTELEKKTAVGATIQKASSN